MENANMMRVGARSGSFAGHGSAPQDKQQKQRQKVLLLMEAIGSGNLEAARQALQSLVNFDANTLADAKFERLSKFLQAGSIYLAQQWAQEFKGSWVSALPQRPGHGNMSLVATIRPDGLHVVDVRA